MIYCYECGEEIKAGADFFETPESGDEIVCFDCYNDYMEEE